MMLIRRILLVAVLSGMVGTPLGTVAQPTPAPQGRHVVILSMDAFRWDLADRARTPTLDSLRRAGTYAEIEPVFPANTFPSHYAMATGLYPDHHGIVNNQFYDRQTGRMRSVFHAEDVRTPGFWGGEPVWNTLERQGGKAHIFMWPGSEVPINGRQATVWTPYSDTVDYRTRADWVVDALSGEDAPQLVMWYFEQPDAVMHTFGPTSPEAVRQAERIDSVLAYFLKRVRSSPHFEQTNFIFTADHGMADMAADRYINLYPLLDSTRVRWTVIYRPFALEVDEAYRDEAMRILSGVKHLRAYRREQMPERYHYGSRADRLSNIIILPDTGWSLDYRPTDRPPKGGASHGFDPADRAMHMVFYGVGPDFRRGYRHPTFTNQNIYLILCTLLGIEPAPNDGSPEAIEGLFVRRP